MPYENVHYCPMVQPNFEPFGSSVLEKEQTSNWIKTKPTEVRPKSEQTYTTEMDAFVFEYM